MKPVFNRINHWPDTHLLLLWLLALPAMMPLFQPTITRSADGLLHLYRVVALSHALQQGQTLFPRWLPDLAYGYGFPLFIFYAPLSYYITLVLSLFSQTTITAFNLSFALALLLAGSGVYLFVKDIFGAKAGLLAGVAYSYAPFQLLNTLSRGGLPAAWAMALFPFVFWLFGRLIKQGLATTTRFTSLLSLTAFAFGLALLTHNTLSLLFVPLLGLYLALELAIRYLRRPIRSADCNLHSKQRNLHGPAIFQVGMAILLGVGLAAFFLIPAIIEKDFAQVERVIISPDFDFHFNFVTFRELFSLPPPADTGLLNPNFPLTLGLVQVGLGGLGLIGLLTCLFRGASTPTCDSLEDNSVQHEGVLHSSHRLFIIIAFTITSLTGIIFMMLPISVGVWERIPLLAFVQFPHRLLGPAAFVLAILAGGAIAALPQRLDFILTLIGIILIFVTTVPLLYPRYDDQLIREPSLVDMMAYEHASGAIGTTSFGEYLPIWVKQVPGESPLEPMYQNGATIERLDPTYLPPEAEIESATYGFNQADLVINSPEAHQVVFHTFYFPGWEALVDGQPVSTAPVTERGLIGVSLPAGRHHLYLHFQETPLRRTANTVSIVTAVTIIIVLVSNKLRSKTNVSAVSRQSSAVVLGFNHSEQFIILGLAITLVIVKVAYLDQFENLLKHTFDGMTVARTELSRQVDFGGQVNLLGYDLDRSTVVSGQSFDLTAYWQARQPLTTNYSALAQLVDDENHLYGGQDNLHPGTMKTTLWQPWGFVQDPHTVPIPPGTPPGDYFLVTGLYDPVTGVRLPVIAGGDSGWPDVIAIPVTVTKPKPPQSPTIEALGIKWPAPTQTSEVLKTSEVSIRLLGATSERETIPRNDFLRIALFWEATAEPTTDYQISLRLLALDGSVALQQTNRPSHNRYPTTRWSAGEQVRDNHALWIPADFPAGEYRVQVQLLDEVGEAAGEWVELGVLGTEE